MNIIAKLYQIYRLQITLNMFKKFEKIKHSQAFFSLYNNIITGLAIKMVE